MLPVVCSITPMFPVETYTFNALSIIKPELSKFIIFVNVPLELVTKSSTVCPLSLSALLAVPHITGPFNSPAPVVTPDVLA